jgi:hypothetical protein
MEVSSKKIKIKDLDQNTLYFLFGLLEEYPNSRPGKISSFFKLFRTVATLVFFDPASDIWT